MAVVGKDCFVFEHTGLTCDVSAFSPDLPITSLPIVDAVIVYDCPYSLQSYLLMLRNALYVDTMNHILLPPFLMREAGVTVNDTAKIHFNKPDNDHHCLIFPNEFLRIPLSLHGVFSFSITEFRIYLRLITSRFYSSHLMRHNGTPNQLTLLKMRAPSWIMMAM